MELLCLAEKSRSNHQGKGSSDRVYTSNQTREIFVDDWNYLTIYTLVGLAKEPVQEACYHQKLQLMEKPTVFNVERVIQQKKCRRQREALFKWEGYPESMNSWVSKFDFEQ